MHSQKLNLIEFLYQYHKDPEFARDNDCWHFYDWFCKDSALEGKSQKLVGYLEKILYSPRFDARKVYVFFKNNCPCNGSLYDAFSLCDIESGDVLFSVTPKSGFTVNNGLGDVWGKENGFDGPLVQSSWKEVVEWFNNPPVKEQGEQETEQNAQNPPATAVSAE